MNITQSIIVMLFAHLITDYTLQGWLADGRSLCHECNKKEAKK